jgi:hypothetical protein
VKLVEVHVIGVETLQAALELGARTLGIAARGLFGEKDLGALWA